MKEDKIAMDSSMAEHVNLRNISGEELHGSLTLKDTIKYLDKLESEIMEVAKIDKESSKFGAQKTGLSDDFKPRI